MTPGTELLAPVIVLVAWSMVMWIWLYATRIPAITAAGIPLDPHLPPQELLSKLPAKVRWKADNYNHLMEQPTVFYALVLAMAMLGLDSALNVYLAWGYVGLRIAHSIFQATVNKIEVRFALFAASNLALFGLTFNGLRGVF